jgi:hypothetical protein
MCGRKALLEHIRSIRRLAWKTSEEQAPVCFVIICEGMALPLADPTVVASLREKYASEAS